VLRETAADNRGAASAPSGQQVAGRAGGGRLWERGWRRATARRIGVKKRMLCGELQWGPELRECATGRSLGGPTTICSHLNFASELQ
jgi:hypothetical protein